MVVNIFYLGLTNNNKLTKEEERFLLDNCEKEEEFLIENLNRSIEAIKQKARRMGLTAAKLWTKRKRNIFGINGDV